jgi:DNA-binding MurR/RpiR family transcriptional regulator
VPSIFVSCPFHGPYKELIAKIEEAAERYSLRTVSVDQPSVALPISDEILREIRESRVVIADITGKNPNVLHEVGLAQAYGKPLILITQSAPSEAPSISGASG